MKDGGKKSEILPFVTLFRDSYFVAYRVHRGGTLVITDRTTPKCIQITIRTLADAKSRPLLSQQDLSYLCSMNTMNTMSK